MTCQASATPAALPSADTLAALVKMARETQFPAISLNEHRLVWPDKQVTDLEPFAAHPRAKRGCAVAVEPAGFTRYLNDHATPGTMIYGEVTEQGPGSYFEALLDGHEPNPWPCLRGSLSAPPTRPDEIEAAREREQGLALVAKPKPGWGQHKARLSLSTSPEWNRWLAATTKPLDQAELAELIEENQPDIVVPPDPEAHGLPLGAQPPSAADLSSIALTLQINSDVRFNSSLRLQNGSTELRFSEAVNGSYGGGEQKLMVPELFCIAAAPFTGGPKFVVVIRLRYRLVAGKVQFHLTIPRKHKVLETAWSLIRERIETDTGLPVLRGAISLR